MSMHNQQQGPRFKVGDRVQDAGIRFDEDFVPLRPGETGFHGIGTVVSVGPSPYFDCGVRWDKPFWMSGEELFLEPKPEEELIPAPEVLLHESSEAPGVYICEHVPLVSDTAEPGDHIVCGDCSDLLDSGAVDSARDYRGVNETAL